MPLKEKACVISRVTNGIVDIEHDISINMSLGYQNRTAWSRYFTNVRACVFVCGVFQLLGSFDFSGRGGRCVLTFRGAVSTKIRGTALVRVSFMLDIFGNPSMNNELV